ncbi:MAG: DUF86 domain-containing protein [bacterium]
MTAKDIAVEHIETLRQGLADWERYKRTYKLKELKNNRDIQNMVLHALLLTIQSCIDTTNYLIAHFGLPKANTYRESFEILSSHGYLNEEIVSELQDLAAFRNVLVHVYWRLDLDRVYEILQTNFQFVYRFFEEVREFLNENETKNSKTN